MAATMSREKMNRSIFQGDVLDQINNIPDESIDTIITSPPYYALRDYGIDGQIGLESTLIEYVDKMVKIVNSWKRVLKPTGSLWLNLGDTYHNSNKWTTTASVAQTVAKGNERGYYGKRKKDQGLRQKTLMGIPQRIQIRLIDDGWILRNTIIWHKNNAMPTSAKDRLQNKYELVYFFTKNEKYYFDLNAIRVPSQTTHKTNTAQQKLTGGTTDEGLIQYDKQGRKLTGGKGNNATLNNRNFMPRKTTSEIAMQAGYDPEDICCCGRKYKRHVSRCRGIGSHASYPTFAACNPRGKNPGDVWTINTQSFPEAHHATFPIELPLKIIKCATPKSVCKKCKTPRYPISEPTPDYARHLGKAWNDHKDELIKGHYKSQTSMTASYHITGYTDCGCGVGFESGIVLDPFFGSGSTAVAAEQLGRNWTGIELNPDYIKIARKRLESYQNLRISKECKND